MSLRKMLKGSGVQVVFSAIFPLGDWDPGRKRQMEQVNDWLRGLCHAWGFGFYDLGCTFERPGMLISDETRWGKSLLGSKLAGLISRALNYIQWGKGMFRVTERNQETPRLSEAEGKYL